MSQKIRPGHCKSKQTLKVPEILPQCLQGLGDMVFDAFHADAEMGGDLPVRFVLVAAHQVELPRLRRQRHKGLVDDLPRLSAEQFLGVTRTERGDPRLQLPLPVLFHLFRRVLAHFQVLEVVEAFVFDDGQYVGRNVGAGAQGLPPVPILHDRLHDEILRHCFVPHIETGKTDEPSAVIREQVVQNI